jgi:hypothetical protein
MKINLTRFSLGVIVLLAALGCDNLLEVDNPNSVLEENLDDPAAANAIASGALATTANGFGYCMAPYTTATDEATWIGSRDGWNLLDRGSIADINNEFTDAAWPFITEARYTCDNAIALLAGFKSANTLKDPKNLVKAYLYSAVTRLTIGDMFDNFVYSNKREVAPPIGRNNMVRVYDEAIAHLDAALPIAQSGASAEFVELQRRVLGMRARAKHAKAVWQLLNPAPITQPLSNPYVNAGADDALAAAALMGVDYKWLFTYPGSISAFNELAWELVGRSELKFADPAIDPIDGIPDPRIAAIINDFRDKAKYGDRNSPITVVSEREMQLIIAESHVASGNQQAAADVLNALRGRNSLKPIPDVAQTGNILIHERRANLFLQGRRLSDMYRFNIQAAQWVAGSDAVAKPGSFFPITIQERRANTLVTPDD